MVMQTTMVAVIKVSVESIAVSQIVNKVKAGNVCDKQTVSVIG